MFETHNKYWSSLASLLQIANTEGELLTGSWKEVQGLVGELLKPKSKYPYPINGGLAFDNSILWVACYCVEDESNHDRAEDKRLLFAKLLRMQATIRCH
jgi:hypothetical protein